MEHTAPGANDSTHQQDLPGTARHAAWLTVFFILYGAVCLALAMAVGFRQSHNDFWDVHFIATHLDAGNSRTWFNPQYPIGYTVLLHFLSGWGGPAVAATLLNIGIAAATIWITGRIAFRILPPVFTVVVVLGLALFFEFFRYANAAGGDPGAVLFFTAGAGLALTTLTARPDRGCWRSMLVAGWLLGVAALFRYHALPAAVLFGVGLWVAWPRRLGSVCALGLGAAGAYLLQWAVNIATGRGLLETQFGPMNVYDLMYGLNWHRITSFDLNAGVRDIIAADPVLFFRNYLRAFWSFKQVWAPPLLAWALVRDPARRRMMFAVSVWITAYFLLFSATTSGRQALIPLPFAMLALGAAVHGAWERLARLRSFRVRVVAHTALVVALVLLAALHFHRDLRWQGERAALHSASVEVEAYLMAAGATSTREVFTSDFDLYFMKLPGVIPYFNGGAPRLGTYRYNEVYPEFPVESVEGFAAAARSRGVRFLVLDDEAARLSPAMEALHESTAGQTVDATGEAFEYAGEFGAYRVFTLR